MLTDLFEDPKVRTRSPRGRRLLDPREAAKVIEDLLYLRAPSKVKHSLNLSSTTPAKVADSIRVYVPDKQPRMSNVTKVR